jgi:hypothetical protein
MKQQGLAIAAAVMLSLCLGIANAGSEQTGMDQTGSDQTISACDSTRNVCLNSEMRDQDQLSQSDAEVGLRVGLQDESMTESSDESQAEDQDNDNDADELALDESQSRPMIIIVQ